MSKPLLTIDVQQRLDVAGTGAWSTIATISRVTSATWELLVNGYYGTCSFSYQQQFNVDGATALAANVTKRLLFRLDGVAVAVGIVKRPVRVWDQIEVQTIPGVGPVQEMERAYVKKQYVAPGGSQDLSWFYYQLARDFILRRGYADAVSIAVLGVERSAVTFDGDLRQAVTDLGLLSDGWVYWGISYDDSTGFTTFFVRKRDPTAAPTYTPTVAVADYDPVADVYPIVLTHIDHTLEDDDLCNTLYIDGGAALYPNLATKNPSFESIKQGGSAASNMLANGDFDENNHPLGSDLWDPHSSGAAIKSQPYLPPHTAANYLELDHNGEYVDQSVVGITPGHTYGFNFQIASEYPTPVGPAMTLTTKLQFYDAASTLLQEEDANWTVDAGIWDGRTQYTLAPPNATRLKVTFYAASTAGINGRGIAVDTAYVYDNSLVYQDGWRVETTPTAMGTDINADPTGAYSVNWLYDYSDPSNVSPGTEYGSYGVYLNAFGVATGRHVRIVNSRDGQIDGLTARQFYTISVTARAENQDGTAPAAGANFRVGIVWFDQNNPPNAHQQIVKDVHLSNTFAIVGGAVELDSHMTAVRMYFEALSGLQFWIDGAMTSQSPELPTEFIVGTNVSFVIATTDVYVSSDAHYDSVLSPPTGYGPLEEKASTPIVLDREDALRYAKTVFDVRSLPETSEAIHAEQVDSPLLIWKPDGYLQATGLSGFTFPKLWPSRIGYSYTARGVECDIELEREVPRLDQLIQRDRALAITKVGTGADVAALYLSPSYETFTVGTDGVLSNSGRPGAAANDVYTVQTTNGVLPAYAEVFVRGFAIDIQAPGAVVYSVGALGSYDTVAITLPVGDAFFSGDIVGIYYYSAGARQYTLRHETFTSVTGGVEQFALTQTPLTGSVRVFVRGFAAQPSNVNMILDGSGNPTIVEIEAGEALVTGDNVDVLYDADFIHPRVLLYDAQTLLGTETSYTVPTVPYQWTDGTYAFVAWVRGFIRRLTITVTAGVATAPLTDINAGDIMLTRWSSA